MKMQNVILENALKIPIFSGFLFLALDKADPRHELLLIVGGLMILLLFFHLIGIDAGATGQTIISAFTLIIGYWFGQKEQEEKGCD